MTADRCFLFCGRYYWYPLTPEHGFPRCSGWSARHDAPHDFV